MMDSLGRYQMASDMGTGGTRAEFGLKGPFPKPISPECSLVAVKLTDNILSEGGMLELRHERWWRISRAWNWHIR